MKSRVIITIVNAILMLLLLSPLEASKPLWTFTPLTDTRINLSTNATATVQYRVTNQSRRTHTLSMRSIPGVTQVTTAGNCSNLFTLAYQQFCTLTLLINGSALQSNILSGPIVCQEGNSLQCYQPSRGDSLNITRIALSYTVGGIVFGLQGTLILQNNQSDTLTRYGDGSYTFSQRLFPGERYSVTVASVPPGQTCTVSNGQGVMGNANVDNVRVKCSTTTYTVGGNISGLSPGDTAILLNNGVDPLPVSANGSFTFTQPVAVGSDYRVTVGTSPSNKTCTVSNGSGVVTSNVTTVNIVCSTITYTLGGTVNGLINGQSLILENNDDNDLLPITSNGNFTFSKPLANGASYRVVVETQPVEQTCTLTNPSGTISGSNVTNIGVTCTTNATTFTLSSTDLNLSVTGVTEYGVPTPGSFIPSGKPRVITVTNTGSAPISNLTVSISPALPSGTTSSCPGGSCGCPSALGVGASCSITITPGSTASTSTEGPCTLGNLATPSVITVSASNANSQSNNTSILGYGCIYSTTQEKPAYIYFLDDSPAANTSIRGKMVQNPAHTSSLWSSTLDIIKGIDERSTPVNPSPNISSPHPTIDLPGCDGATDGTCNSNNIIVYYNEYTPPSINYAAYVCHNIGEIWSLPAVCQISSATLSSFLSCSDSQYHVQNIKDSNIATIGNYLPGYYWSSTEDSNSPKIYAWAVRLPVGGQNTLLQKDLLERYMLCIADF